MDSIKLFEELFEVVMLDGGFVIFNNESLTVGKKMSNIMKIKMDLIAYEQMKIKLKDILKEATND